MHRFFRFVVAKRYWVVALYALLLVPAAYLAIKVEHDNSLDRLVVQSDPDYIASKGFEKVFGAGEYVVLLAEASDPFAPAVLARVDELERRLGTIPGVSANSAISVFRRAKAGFSPDAAGAAAFKTFAKGSPLFSQQGLVGRDFLAVALVMSVTGGRDRTRLVTQIDEVLRPYEAQLAPLAALRKVGQPYVNTYLDADTKRASLRYFPLFMVFVIVLNVLLYRSVRTLIAFIVTLGVSAAFTVGFIGLVGGTFTITSSLVPMTILITCTATLVYIHSRFVERPEGRPVDEHQIDALSNKFLPCTVSIAATAVGFAALVVSKIRPIRELGLWVAAGLVFTWLAVFTLFPALQRLLRTPTQQERKIAGQWFVKLCQWLPFWSYRYRFWLVPGSLLVCALGLVALFGLPGGALPPMRLLTNAVEYIPHDSALYKDTKALEKKIAGLAVAEVWLKGKLGAVTEPGTLRALDAFEERLRAEPTVGAAIGPTTVLRMLRYAGGSGDALPKDDEELEQLSDSVETLLPREPMLQRFFERPNLSQTHVSVITRIEDYEGFVELRALVTRHFKETQAAFPALKDFTFELAGTAPLQAKIAHYMVPTLVESFGLTVAIIFGTFLLVFRSGAARLMAMIPSLFAILAMFAFMRVTGIFLNVATILIASTVLGTSENDQIHFFYHFLERKGAGPRSTQEGLEHTLFVSGRAIFFATLINAGGFLAFALADLPPIRQFGILSALSFVLSMIAAFTALPAALWLVYRQRPVAASEGSKDAKDSEPGSSSHAEA